MKNRKHLFTESIFIDTPIKCDNLYPTNRKILEFLYVLIFQVSQSLKRPCGYHVRIRFTERMTASEFSARLAVYYKRKSKHVPLKVCAAECDPGQTELHYHYAIILDQTHNKIGSLKYLIGNLQKSGHIHDYCIKSHDDAPLGLPLDSNDNQRKYMRWMSYIAKTSTKPDHHQTHSASQSIYKATRNWIKAGRPSLQPQLSTNTEPTAIMPLDGFFLDDSGVSDVRIQ